MKTIIASFRAKRSSSETHFNWPFLVFWLVYFWVGVSIVFLLLAHLVR